ncbi:MAG TPA: excinuclease ABC subunit UvrC [Polyangiaceae bacterium]|nr:excinuclease ABC subunit UvrC [Polyangiaceae bacterium]
MLPETVAQKLESLPARPGCYLFRDGEGAVVYVGKAKSLRARVRSYFQEGSSDTRPFIPVLLRVIGDLETRVVGSEKEAAILENELIKEHRPRFNVKLRDDKDFLSLKLDPKKPWPRLEVVRRPQPDGARYFGPYPSSSGARRTLHLVNKYFQLRTCTDAEMAARRRPCLQYQIKRCPAPCVLEVDRGEYGAQVRAVELFLDGRHDELTQELDARMREASRQMRFEDAATYRDQIRAIASMREAQRIVGERDVDQDVLGLFRQGGLAELAVIYVRAGRVRDTATFSIADVELDDDELVAGFLRQYYDEAGPGAAGALPDEILLPMAFEGVEGVAEWLSERRGRKVAVLAPRRGDRADLVRLAGENAEHAFREKRREVDDVDLRLGQLQQRLKLPALPRRIECVDISHLGGNDTVGAVVSLYNGQPQKSRYRIFRVRGAAAGDDYGAMYEVLARRFRRGKAARGGSPPPPPAAAAPAAADGAPSEATSYVELAISPTPPPAAAVEAAVPAARGRRKGRRAPGASGAAAPPPAAGGARAAEPSPDADKAHAAPTPDADGAHAAVASRSGADEAHAALALDPGEGGDALELTPSPPPVVARAPTGPDGEGGDGPMPLAELGPPSRQAGEGWELPDLLVVDGGRGQLNVALTAARDLGLHDLPVVGLAKERVTLGGEELVDRVYVPGQKNGIPLRPQSAALFFLARARDEAHRFSNYARERLAKSRSFRSLLDDVPGLSKRARVALLTAFGSAFSVRDASDAELLAVPGVGPRAVEALRAHYGPRPAGPPEGASMAQQSPPVDEGPRPSRA